MAKRNRPRKKKLKELKELVDTGKITIPKRPSILQAGFNGDKEAMFTALCAMPPGHRMRVNRFGKVLVAPREKGKMI